MKNKTLLVIFVLLIIVQLISCGNLNTIESQNSTENNILPTKFSYTDVADRPLEGDHGGFWYDDDCIYFRDITTLLCYNTVTGTTTYVCKDPLCAHQTSNCPMSGIEYFRIHNGNVYMLKSGETLRDKYLSEYDVKSGKERVLVDKGHNDEANATSFGVKFSVSDDYLYYFEDYSYDREQTEEDETRVLYRVELSTLKVEKVMSYYPNSGTTDSFAGIYDSKAVFRDAEGWYYKELSGDQAKHYFYDPEENTVVIGCFMFENGMVVMTREKDKKIYDYSLLSLDGNTKYLGSIDQSDPLTAALDQYVFTDNYIYFRKDGERRNAGQISDKDGNISDLFISEPNIYRTNAEGITEGVFVSFPADELYSTCSVSRFIAVGNYIYAPYIHYGDKVKEVYSEKDFCGALQGFLRYDLTTKEIIYVAGK